MPDDGTAMIMAAGNRSPERLVAHVPTVAFRGIDVLPVDVQVQIGPGMPAFTIVG